MTVASNEASARLAEALRRGDDFAVTTTRTAIVIVMTPAPIAVDRLPVGDAAKYAATTTRVLGEAIRTGVLPASGGQRDRSILRADLDAWIASRAVKPTTHAAIDDADLERRMRRIAGSR